MKSDKDIDKIVAKYFDNGFNCAESVLLAGCDIFGLEQANVPRIATAFGGGLSGAGHTCGAISGALMLLGLRYGRDKSAELDKKRKVYSLVDSFLADFNKQFGDINCRALTGVDFKTEAGVKKYKQTVHHEVCVPIVEFVTGWLAKTNSVEN